jgi:hypothetical protein
MRRAVLIIATALTAIAQTHLLVQQLRGGTSANGQVVVALPNGTMVPALLDSAFSIDMTGPRPVLRVTLPEKTKVARLKVVAGANPAQAYLLEQTGLTGTATMVYRNGVLQSEGDDYSFTAEPTAARIQFNPTPPTTIQTGDIVQIVALL